MLVIYIKKHYAKSTIWAVVIIYKYTKMLNAWEPIPQLKPYVGWWTNVAIFHGP